MTLTLVRFVATVAIFGATYSAANANPFKICLADKRNDCTRVGAPADAIFYEHNKGIPVSDEAAAQRFCSTYMINGKPATKYSHVRLATSKGGSAGIALISITGSE